MKVNISDSNCNNPHQQQPEQGLSCINFYTVYKDPANKKHLKPLSHQGSVLMVIPRWPKKLGKQKIAERRGARSTNASIAAVASPLDKMGSLRTLSDGAHIEHTQNKHRHSAFARHPNRVQRRRCKFTDVHPVL